MASTLINTEEQILLAAKEVFFKKGLKAATMQSIADVAGINRTLLNYYFRTKNKLYEKVLIDTLKQRTIQLGKTLGKAKSIDEFIERMVDYYYDYNIQLPEYPNFYVMAILESPEKVINIFENFSKKKHPLIQIDELVQKAIKDNIIRQIDSEHLFWIINSACYYPFLIKSVIYKYQGRTTEEFNLLMRGLKDEIKTLVWNGIRKNI